MWYLVEHHVLVSVLRPSHPSLDVFKTFDEVHKHADDFSEARGNEVKEYDTILPERTKQQSRIRLFTNTCNAVLCRGLERWHILTSLKPKCYADVAVSLIAASELLRACDYLRCASFGLDTLCSEAILLAVVCSVEISAAAHGLVELLAK